MAVLESGKVYNIVNIKSNTLLHIPNTKDQQTQVVCWSRDGTDNQKWHLESKEGYWIISNAFTGHLLSYLPEPDSVEFNNGLSVIGVLSQSFKWKIVPEEESGVYRIFVPNAPVPGKNVDLAEHGSSIDGTHVILWSPWSGINQTWRFEEA